MDKTEGYFDVHVFVCTNEKKGSASCGPLGAEEMRRDLKEWAKHQPGWGKKIRINAAGCMDRCKEGVAVAIYPQNKWFINVGKDSLDDLKRKITKLMNDKE